MTKKYSIEELEKATGLIYHALNIYLGRYEFSHIERERMGRKVYFTNVSHDDIERLIDLKNKRRPPNDPQLDIINHYGYKNQLLKLVEELRELEQVIIYHPEDEEHLIEEIADVKNLIEQISKFKNWQIKIEREKQFKIKRQKIRMQNENN
jgi:DNA mismatch repair ATPase MutS